jgi:hypothetical protein
MRWNSRRRRSRRADVKQLKSSKPTFDVLALSRWIFAFQPFLCFHLFPSSRYMGLPQENKEGYDNGACLPHLDNIQGSMLLCHGLMVILLSCMCTTTIFSPLILTFVEKVFFKNHTLLSGHIEICFFFLLLFSELFLP